jgi:hypothetical protein
MIGPIAGSIDNIAIPIALGIGSALISVIYHIYIFPKINKNNIYDNLGLFGPYLLIAFLGTLVVAPITFISYYIY